MAELTDAQKLRAWLKLDGPTIVGGVGMAGGALRRVLDRLDELEWVVSMMRAASAGEAGTAETVEQGSVHGHATGVAGDAQKEPDNGQ